MIFKMDSGKKLCFFFARLWNCIDDVVLFVFLFLSNLHCFETMFLYKFLCSKSDNKMKYVFMNAYNTIPLILFQPKILRKWLHSTNNAMKGIPETRCANSILYLYVFIKRSQNCKLP